MEKLVELTPRLQTVADLVPEGTRFVDIGTDHAFLPVHLLQRKKVVTAIAADIRSGPLSRAKATGESYGMGVELKFCLCDGLVGISPDEVDTIAIAGMGGETIVHILRASPWAREKTLILQPMSTQPELRKYLWEAGMSIVQEKTVCEGELLYNVLLVKNGEQSAPSQAELWAGRQWKGMIDPLRGILLQRTREKLGHALERMEQGSSPRVAQRRQELTELQMALGEMEEEWNGWQQ